MEKVGIEILKGDVVAIAKTITKVDNALEDNKISIVEWAGLAVELPKVFKIAKGYKARVEEIKDLSEEELGVLSTYFADQFDIRNDAAENIVEQVVAIIVSLASAFVNTKAIN